MAEQLTFDLTVRPSLDRGDFFVSPANALAVARLDDPAGWPLGKLVLVGPEGAGKTHLAHVWAESAGARVLSSSDLATLDIGALDAPVAVDDADRLPPQAETALFHLHNRLSDLGLPLLLTARDAPARWTVALPDLKSRMQGTDLARIEAPDDALLAAVLVKLFADRQIRVGPRVIAWLTVRIGRSFAEARDAVEKLDRAALAHGRAVTPQLAAEILDNP